MIAAAQGDVVIDMEGRPIVKTEVNKMSHKQNNKKNLKNNIF